MKSTIQSLSIPLYLLSNATRVGPQCVMASMKLRDSDLLSLHMACRLKNYPTQKYVNKIRWISAEEEICTTAKVNAGYSADWESWKTFVYGYID